MAMPTRCAIVVVLLLVGSPLGCRSPYYAGRGAGVGALAGAGVGALVGSASGNAGAGAAIGAGVGALTGGVVGSEMDRRAAENRAAIAAQMGRQVATGVATTDEVIAMSRAGIAPQLMVQYVQTSGMAQPITASDVVYLHQQGVPEPVIQAMMAPPAPPQGVTPVVAQAPAPVIIEEHPWGPPVFYPPPRHCYPHRGGPRVGWSISVGH